MCGIALLFNKRPINDSLIKKMTDIIDYRGPDDEDQKRFLNGCLWLGHRRLSIIDLSKAGRQPMSYENKRYWISYNGELYNYLELRKALEQLGKEFKTDTDTEVIMAAYAEWGNDCLKQFNGMWAFVIFDEHEKTVFGARDRFGIKPFYYSVDKNRVGISSEIKQLLITGFGTNTAHRDEVARFLLFGDVNISSQTFFEGIYQLQPGQMINWRIDDGVNSLKITKYYDPEYNRAIKPDGKLKVYQEEFSYLIEDSIRLRLRGDVPVGSCLSGGMDSSSIVAIANQLRTKHNHNHKQKTFTSCFDNIKFDESEFARQVADFTDAEHYTIYPKMDNILDELNDLTWHQEEPFRSTSIYAQWNVMRLAKQNKIKILLDGQGADEYMAGYHYLIPLFLASSIKKNSIIKVIKSISELNSTGVLSVTASSQTVLLKTLYYLFNLQSFRKQKNGQLLRKSYVDNCVNIYSSDFQTMLYDSMFGNLQSLLRHEDRNSMAFSIEARTPFLDYRLVELFLRMPGEYKFRDGWTKQFLREKVKGILPETVRLRVDKKGFVTPESVWYQEHFGELKQILLSKDSSIDLWVDMDKLKKLMKQPEAASNSDLWKFISVSFWMNRFELN